MKKILILTSIVVLMNQNLNSQEATTSEKAKVISYIGLNIGAAIPIGEFANTDRSNNKSGLATSGLSLSLVNFGMIFNEQFGFNLRWMGNVHPIDQTTNQETWGYGAIMVGPTYSLNLFKNAYLDFKPSIGLMASQYSQAQKTLIEGTGLGLGLGSQMRFNFAKKWAATFNLDYITTNQKIKLVSSPSNTAELTMTGLSTNLGMIYYFKAPNYK